MTKQTHPLRHALPALLLAGMAWLPMRATTYHHQTAEPPGQNPSTEVYAVAEKMPEFPGGSAAMFTYIRQNIQYPKEAGGQEGRVILQFTVDTLGQLHDVTVARGRHPALDEEAVRVVQSMPAWTPGEHAGRKVAVRYTLPVAFEATYGFDEVDVKPEFPGGGQAMFQYVGMNLRYPAEAVDNGEKGRVVVGFTITDQGKIQDVHVLESVSPSLDLEAARLIATMPDWTPGQMNGQPVHVRHSMPVNFNM